jgi:hypothetical protein
MPHVVPAWAGGCSWETGSARGSRWVLVIVKGKKRCNPVPSKYYIRPKMGLDWTYEMHVSWIVTVHRGINSQPSRFNSS